MGGIFREIVEHVLRQPIRKVLKHVAEVVGVDAGLTALDGDAAVRIHAGHLCGKVQIEELIPERGTVRCVACTCSAQRGRTQPLDKKSQLSDVECLENCHGSRLGSRHMCRNIPTPPLLAPQPKVWEKNPRPPENIM